jgi:hypothetical protein
MRGVPCYTAWHMNDRAKEGEQAGLVEARELGRPHLERFRRTFGTRVVIRQFSGLRPQSLPSGGSLVRAVLHDRLDDFAFRIETTGLAADEALDRLEKLLGELDRA